MKTSLQNVFETSVQTGNNLFLTAYRVPDITAYNRLEPRARTENFVRSLRAEIRDPLWMLTRQWQMGELEAEDAGSAIDARLLTTQAHVDRIALREGAGQQYDLELPLETIVEREVIPFTHALRVQIGQYFLKLHTPALRAKYAASYLTAFPFAQNEEDKFRGQVNGLNLYTATRLRDFDGEQLLTAINNGTLIADAGIDAGADETAVGGFATQLTAWLARQYSQPGAESQKAWDPHRLTYSFRAAAPKGTATAGQFIMKGGLIGTHSKWICVDKRSRLSPRYLRRPLCLKNPSHSCRPRRHSKACRIHVSGRWKINRSTSAISTQRQPISCCFCLRNWD
jgi:hypothetical protein